MLVRGRSVEQFHKPITILSNKQDIALIEARKQ